MINHYANEFAPASYSYPIAHWIGNLLCLTVLVNFGHVRIFVTFDLFDILWKPLSKTCTALFNWNCYFMNEFVNLSKDA